MNPKTSMIINCVIAGLGFIAASGAAFTTLVGSHDATIVVTVAGLALGLVSTINVALHGYSSSQAGPLTDAPVKIPTPPLPLILIALLLVISDSAFAQKGPPAPPLCAADILKLVPGCQTTPDLINTIKGSLPGPRGNDDLVTRMMNDLTAIKKEIVDGIVADLTAADADASAIDPNTGQMNDPIAHACYPAQIKFLQSLPVTKQPTPPPNLVQLFQFKRDFVRQLQAGIPTYLKLGCSPLLGDEIQIFIQTMNTVGVKVLPAAATALFPAAAPVTLPAMILGGIP